MLALPADRASLLRAALSAIVAALTLASMGCRGFRPTNDRDWAPGMEKLASAEFNRNVATVHNIRLCEYRTADDFTVHYYDKTYDLRKLDTVDFIVVPF